MLTFRMGSDPLVIDPSVCACPDGVDVGFSKERMMMLGTWFQGKSTGFDKHSEGPFSLTHCPSKLACFKSSEPLQKLSRTLQKATPSISSLNCSTRVDPGFAP